MASKTLTLRCKHKNGQTVLNSISLDMTVDEFKATLFSLVNIEPRNMKILIGFPPKPLDLSNDQLVLEQLPIKSGETIIVEETSFVPTPSPTSSSVELKDLEKTSESPREKDRITPMDFVHSHGILMRKIVPANNSCLFSSIDFNLSEGNLDPMSGSVMRKVIAKAVASDPETFNEAFLGKSNKDYCDWILNEDHWGGAIELSVLSKHFGIEIAAVDTQNVCIHRFGEDNNYDRRILLIYDGVHYDPLLLEPTDGSGKILTIFSALDDQILQMALEIAREAKSSHQFTDVQSFTLRCLVCNKSLIGHTQAQVHAKETGHINFGEI